MKTEREFFASDVDFVERARPSSAPGTRSLRAERPGQFFPTWLVSSALVSVLALTVYCPTASAAGSKVQLSVPEALPEDEVISILVERTSLREKVVQDLGTDPDIIYREPQDLDGLARLLAGGRRIDSVDHLLEDL